MFTKQISVFLENRPGTLAEFCKVLRDHQIDMRALCLADAMDFGICRLIVDDVFATMTVLKEADYVCQITDVLTVEMEDKPGALGDIMTYLGDKEINVEYTYAFLTRKKDSAYLVLKTNDAEAALKALREKRVKVISQEELEEALAK